MKEVLYRAKDIESGEWVYGNYVETIEEYTKPSENYWVYAIIEKTVGGNRYMGEYSDLGWHKIDRNTLCEYTGLTDKNGNKIFDGDIVTANGKPLFVRLYEFSWQMCSADGQYFHRFEKEDSNKFVVIGNIYDNADLLSDKE